MPPKTQPVSLADEVLSHARAVRRGPVTWFERLPSDVQAELEALKRRLNAGELGDLTKNALAKGLEQSLRSRGLLTVRIQEISRWLAR